VVFQQILEANHTLERSKLNSSAFDREMWDAGIVGRLSCNRYRKLFHGYQAYPLQNETTAAALDSVCSNPFFCLMESGYHQKYEDGVVDDEALSDDRFKLERLALWRMVAKPKKGSETT
jgi:hypothetical protein